MKRSARNIIHSIVALALVSSLSVSVVLPAAAAHADSASPLTMDFKSWPNILHKAGAWNIITPSEVDTAAANGLSLTLNTYYYPTSPLVQEMATKGMRYIDSLLWEPIYQACKASYKEPYPPCTISAAQEITIEAAVTKHLAEVQNDPNIVGFWVLDDSPGGGNIRPTLEAIHTLIAHANASSVFPRPAICGFGGQLNWKTSSDQPSFNQDHTYIDQALTNFSPTACDMVLLYSYGSSAWNDQRAIDWSMTNLLPYMRQALIARGWNPATQPLIGTPQTFGTDRTIDAYVTPSSASIETQTAAYCAGGASAVISYAWHDSYVSSLNPTNPELYNNQDMRTGYAAGIRQCQAIWQHAGTPSGAGYTMADLGTLGGPMSDVYSVNDLGQAVGEAETASNVQHAFLWQSGAMTDWGTLGGTSSYAFGINDAGQIVGRADTANGDRHAVLWHNGSLTDLGTLGGATSMALAINATGQVAGSASTASGEEHAFLWQSGTMTDLGTLGGTYSIAYGINDTGQIAGYAETVSGAIHAVIWENGTPTDLGTLGGTTSYANGINAAGQVIGQAEKATGAQHALAWLNGVMHDLGTLGGASSVAYGSNSAGQVVGLAETTSGDTHAVLWHDGTLTDLNTLLPSDVRWQQLLWAHAITEGGQIGGQGIINGQMHAFLLTRVQP